MDSSGTLANVFARIRRKLLIFLNPGRRNCALCGKRLPTMHEEIRETNGMPICRSCFELILKKADIDYRANDSDEL